MGQQQQQAVNYGDRKWNGCQLIKWKQFRAHTHNMEMKEGQGSIALIKFAHDLGTGDLLCVLLHRGTVDMGGD